MSISTIAAHEAGHAVVITERSTADVLTATVRAASGVVTHTVLTDSEAELRVCVAGLAGEIALLGEQGAQRPAGDCRDAAVCIAVLTGSRLADVEPVERHPLFLRTLHQVVQHLVRRDHVVRAVATALDARGTLTGGEVRSVMHQADEVLLRVQRGGLRLHARAAPQEFDRRELRRAA